MTCATNDWMGRWLKRFPSEDPGWSERLPPLAAADDALAPIRLSGAELRHRPLHFGARGSLGSCAARVADRAEGRAEHRERVDGEKRRRPVREEHPLLLVGIQAAGGDRSGVETAGREHVTEVRTAFLHFDAEVRLELERVEQRGLLRRKALANAFEGHWQIQWLLLLRPGRRGEERAGHYQDGQPHGL